MVLRGTICDLCSVTVAEAITALYQRAENSIFKYISALHEIHTSIASGDLLVFHHYPSHLTTHTGNLDNQKV